MFRANARRCRIRHVPKDRRRFAWRAAMKLLPKQGDLGLVSHGEGPCGVPNTIFVRLLGRF